MQLVAEKFNLQAFTQSKAFRFANYVVMSLVVVALFAIMNNAMAIEESSLGTDLNASGSGTAGDVNTASTVLGAPVNWLLKFMNGTGGLLAAMLGLLLTLYSAFVAKSLVGTILSVGIALVALYGPKVLMAFFGATI
ncbi:hypothetical protein HCY52_07665 [Acinetobacter radioresistens]|uniref:hypothetical protein n=1 Tax=Acinetobacter radioresistens TaxID=40216 RepID=UPI00200382B1|nr:hypothetical protein [Acinetobacter radioresistens]MCK4083690.1 hypothetical protein [Acinetobacter radioresistens]